MTAVLSLFPGFDLLGRAFRHHGFTVVAGPDLIVADDIRDFRSTPGMFGGVIGGPPCPDFSCARAASPIYDGDGVEMIIEFARVVYESQPTWFLMENVPAVPDVRIAGYSVQRFDLTDYECGGITLRWRHFQFGHRSGYIVRPRRRRSPNLATSFEPAATTKTNEVPSFAELCRRQGLTQTPKLPGWGKEAKHRLIGNAVPWKMGLTLAEAVDNCGPVTSRDCPCMCGRIITGNKTYADQSCRQRASRAKRFTQRPTISYGV